MNPRTTGILALVACLLGAFAWCYEIEGEGGREALRSAEQRLFPGVAAADVAVLELTTSDGVAARFERRDGSWRVVAPIEGRGDAMALDAIAGALAELARAGAVKAAADDRAQFGLGPDARALAFEAAGERHVLRIGRETPVGGHVYVSADAGDAVDYVERYRINAFDRALGDLRDRRILALAADDVARVELAWPEASGSVAVALERAADGDWRLHRPVDARADQQTVRELLSNLEYLQATGFVDERTPAVEAALGETALEVAWSGRPEGEATGEGPADGDSGASASGGRLRIAGLESGTRLVESGDGALHRIAPERLDDFARDPAAYRDRQLVDLEPDALGRIELELGEAPAIVLERGEAGWTAGERALDGDAVDGLAAELAVLRAETLVADGMGDAELASLGLAPPVARLRIGQAEPVVLELGRLDPERGLFVRRAGESAVFVLSPSVAETIPTDRAAFEARYGAKAADEGDAAEAADADAPSIAPGADPLE